MLYKSPSSKRRILTATLLSTLLVTALAGIQSINLAGADERNTAEPPIIVIKSPENNTYAGKQVNFSFTVRPGEIYSVGTYPPHGVIALAVQHGGEFEMQIIHIHYKVDERQINVFTYSSVRPCCEATEFSFNLTNLCDGPHSIVVFARERMMIGGYYQGYSFNASVVLKFTVDTIPPRISVVSPEPKVYYAPDIWLNFTVNEAIPRSTYSLDGQKNMTASGNIMLTELSTGAHNVTVYAWDEAGNVGASETVTFTVEQFPTALITVAVLASAVAVGAGLLLYFKKRNH